MRDSLGMSQSKIAILVIITIFFKKRKNRTKLRDDQERKLAGKLVFKKTKLVCVKTPNLLPNPLPT
jgi:hypothetical protein